MNTIIQAHNSKMTRLANVSQARRSQELDFFTEASYKYHRFINSPSADNPYKNTSLEEKVTKFFIEEAQRPDGIIAKQTKLNININTTFGGIPMNPKLSFLSWWPCEVMWREFETNEI